MLISPQDGFSDSAMRQQESLIVKYVNLLLRRLHEKSENGATPLNAEAWYNFITFDITGELVFGESFGSLEASEYHPWIKHMFSLVHFGALTACISYLGFHWLVQFIYRNAGTSSARRLRAVTENMVRNRLEMKNRSDDLFEGLARRREEWNLSLDHLSSNALILLIAGSETTATTLSGATYLALAHPEVLERLTKEVRSAFSSADEITISSAGKLSYMLAVLNESLRMYPPVLSNMLRQVPKGGAMVAGHFVAENVSLFAS